MILNDSYAEYIKNGYNYDLWNQKHQEWIATVNTIISGIQAGVGLIAGGANFGVNLAHTIPTVIETNRIARAAKQYNSAAKSFYNVVSPAEDKYILEESGTIKPNPISKYNEIATKALNDSNANLNAARAARSEAVSKLFSDLSGVGALVMNNGINAINSAYNSHMSIESSKRSFSNAVNSRANIPISASGSVPTDLFDNYSSNKLTRYEFTIRQEDKTNLFNTFRLTGYAHPVQEKPVFNTRIYSNFVQCKPVFLNSSTEIYKVYLDDISLRFQAGVTVKHNYKGKYDLYDQYENYETIVMEE